MKLFVVECGYWETNRFNYRWQTFKRKKKIVLAKDESNVITKIARRLRNKCDVSIVSIKPQFERQATQ